MHIFYFGFPGRMGGANTEMLHTLPLWRAAGIEVTVVPTWGEPEAAIAAKLQSIGCRIVRAGGPAEAASIAGLSGAVCHSMCNAQFWRLYPLLKKLGCKTVWSSA